MDFVEKYKVKTVIDCLMETAKNSVTKKDSIKSGIFYKMYAEFCLEDLVELKDKYLAEILFEELCKITE